MASADHGLEAASLPSQLLIWSQAIAFRSFTASVVPVTVGSLLALVDHQFSVALFVLMLLAAVSCHAGANLANDYFDYKKGIDNTATGFNKVLVKGQLTVADVKRAMVIAFSLATALGVAIVIETNWKILVLALASLAAAYFYTGGPKPLGYMALGEVIAFVFMGPVMVGGAYFAMADRLTASVMLVAGAIGCLVAAIMQANNMRDIETDRAARKKTIAQLSGRTFANWEHLALTSGGFALILFLVALHRTYWPLLAAGFALPTSYRLTRLAWSAIGRAQLNALLRGTAGLHLRFGSLLILGLLLRVLLNLR